VAKFQGDRSRELGERVAKKKEKKRKTSLAFYKTSRYYRKTGGLKSAYYIRSFMVALVCTAFVDYIASLDGYHR